MPTFFPCNPNRTFFLGFSLNLMTLDGGEKAARRLCRFPKFFVLTLIFRALDIIESPLLVASKEENYERTT